MLHIFRLTLLLFSEVTSVSFFHPIFQFNNSPRCLFFVCVNSLLTQGHSILFLSTYLTIPKKTNILGSANHLHIDLGSYNNFFSIRMYISLLYKDYILVMQRNQLHFIKSPNYLSIAHLFTFYLYVNTYFVP